MKRGLVIFAFLITIGMGSSVAQGIDPKAQTEKIAYAIAAPLYGYDFSTVASVLETMAKDNDHIRAVEILDFNSDTIIFQAFWSDGKFVNSVDPIQETKKVESQLFIQSVVHEQEEIAELRLYFSKQETVKLALDTKSLFIVSLVLLLILCFVIPISIKRIKVEKLAAGFGSVRFRVVTIFGLSVFVSIILVMSWLVIQNNKNIILKDTGRQLETVLLATADRLDYWAEQKRNYLKQLGRDPDLVVMTRRLLGVQVNRDALAASTALRGIRNFFETNNETFSNSGFFIINPDHLNIASNTDAHLGTPNLVAIKKPELLERAFQGDSVFIPPIQSDESLKGSDKLSNIQYPPMMFFLAPIRDTYGTTISVLAQRVDPADEFSRVLQSSRVGESGESYAFDHNARLLSESRFDHHLREIGLIKGDQSGILNIEIRDPGGNMVEGFRHEGKRVDLPLTLMAESTLQLKAKRERTGHQNDHSQIILDINGYRDYRGVPVFGAWLWEEHLGIGLTSEIDVAEALSTYYAMRNTNLAIVGTTLFLFVGATLFVLVLGERTNRFLMRARDDLEIKVLERTAELEENKEQLEEAEERSRLLLQSAGDGIFGVGADGLVNFINPAALAMIGYLEDEIIGKEIHHLIHHSRADGTPYPIEACPMHHSLMEGAIGNVDDEVLWRKDGTSFSVEYTSVPMQKDANVIGSVVLFRDITDRKKAEEALRENEEMLSKITSSALSAIIMLSSETGKISFWNQTAEKIFGWKEQEVIGKKLHELIIPQQYRERHWEGLKQFRHTGEGALIGRSTEISALNRAGEEFPVELNLSAVKLQDQWHAIGLITDITDRKLAERELHEAKEVAEEATQAKSDFLANMSHEIRTPMNAIIGLSHLCLGTELEPRQRDYIEKVYQSSQSLLGIINDILDFSKIEAGKLVIESIPFRLDEVLDSLGNLIAIKAQEKGLELLFDTHPDVPSALVGDPLRLGQILLNLAGNAVKFTEKGEIVVHTETVRITENEVEIRVSVQDTGIGMTQEQCDRMFQSFSQADTSTTRKYGGTGLGLAISKKLTELMGGHIWVESKPGVGSAFIFTAVFGRASDMEKTLHKATPADLDQLKVLVVDDVASSREMLAATLSAFSFRVTCVNSGQDALAALEAVPADDPFKLVLMDWKMPGMDGIEATTRIKNHPALRHMPTVIMITAYGREEVMQQAEAVGLEGFLIKPITPSTLLDTIMGVLGEKGGFRGAARSDDAWKIKPIDGIRGAHLLLAEDNKINQQVAQELLGQAGLNVTIANNGKEAVELLKKTSFDAVLMDMQMPEMDGYEATRTIRRIPEFTELPIIAMTANVMAGDREKCLEAGMNDHVAKPIDPDKLFSTLVEWISPRTPVGPLAETRPSVSMQANEILPAKLEGVDIETGLKRVGGNRNFYRKLLVDFYQDHRKDGQSIREAITADHLDVATRVAHTIKGVSGSIGAAELQRDAEKLEAALKGRDTSSYDNLLSNFDQSLRLVMQELSVLSTAHKREETQPSGVDTVDLDSIRPMLDQLHLQLEEMDPDAEETAALLIDKLGAGPQHNLLTALKKQVDDFEFEMALETLMKLRDKLEDTTETG